MDNNSINNVNLPPVDNNSINNVNLPPGFRFYPTDEELVLHFLHRKKTPLLPFHPDIIPDLHLYSYDPWQLHGRALAEGNKWYYYSRRSTQNRVTHNGYWKPTGIEEPVISSTKNNKRIGMKKHFVYHMGESSVGIKTNWIMHEFRLSHTSANSSSSSKIKSEPIKDYSKWVICRVYESNGDDDDNDDDDDGTDQLSCLDEVFLSSLDDFDEISLPNYN